MAKLIYVSGASFTGTTMMGLILANQSNGFAMGEVWSIFRKGLPEDVATDEEWQVAYSKGRKWIHFYFLNNYDVVTDSSKRIGWVRHTSRRIRRLTSHKIHHVLMYKEPINAFHSFWNRKYKKFDKFYQIYSTYYKQYLKNFGPPDIWVQLEQFTKWPESTTEHICKILSITYIPKKHAYWHRTASHIRGAGKVRRLLEGRISAAIFSKQEYHPDFPLTEAKKLIPQYDWSFLP